MAKADKIIKLKINVKLIDKAKLFPGKDGAQYLDATLFYNEEEDRYGNCGMIVQDVSKEERAAGKQGAILGNGKEFGKASKPSNNPNRPGAAPAVQMDNGDDDLPF